MSVEIRVPELGESIFEATIAKWLKHQGEPVSAGDPLVELETDKVNLEVAAPRDGVVESILKQNGQNVKVGEVLGMLAEGVATAGAESASAPKDEVAVQSGAGRLRKSSSAPMEEAKATPIAKNIAAEHGIDIGQVVGTGPGGRVTKEDVKEYVEKLHEKPAASPVRTEPGATAAPAASTPSNSTTRVAVVHSPQVLPRYEERIRLSRRRQTIARRLLEARRTTAMTTTYNEIDMSAVMELRNRRRASFKERYGIDLGYMSFFTRAAVAALMAFPRVNSELQGDELVLKYYYDIGVAIGADEGLVVPVLRDADKKSFAQIEETIAGMVARSRERKLTIEELQGGTFSITNGGVFGSLFSTPILNPPQVAILGMHRIVQRPIVLDGQVVARPMMYVALTYDHQVVDGREAVQFLVRIKELVEDPARLLIEV